jgi:hypothetical protein
MALSVPPKTDAPLAPDRADLPLTFDAVAQAGTALGTGAMTLAGDRVAGLAGSA